MNTKDLAIGDQIKTSKGFPWTLFSKDGGDTWRNDTDGTFWHPRETRTIARTIKNETRQVSLVDEQATHVEALSFQTETKRLPTKEDWESAAKCGVGEILDEMHRSYWSATQVPDTDDHAYFFSAIAGRCGITNRHAPGGAVRMVSKDANK